MVCPNCGREMILENFDNQNILHCSFCNGNFFDENAINRITLKTAKKLTKDKKNNYISSKIKFCPKDHYQLSVIKNDQAVPKSVILLQCPKCKGIFAYPDDLLYFKKAQKAKIDFYKIWHKPLPALRSVILISFLAISSFSILIGLSSIQQARLSQSQADEIANNIYISTSDRYLFISFKTKIPLRSVIVFINNKTGEIISKKISKKPKKLHYITIDQIPFDEEWMYQIILYDKNNKAIKTPIRKLSQNLPLR